MLIFNVQSSSILTRGQTTVVDLDTHVQQAVVSVLEISHYKHSDLGF